MLRGRLVQSILNAAVVALAVAINHEDLADREANGLGWRTLGRRQRKNQGDDQYYFLHCVSLHLKEGLAAQD